jgi:hypothetical protein
MDNWALIEQDYCSGKPERVIPFPSRHEAERYLENLVIEKQLKDVLFHIVPIIDEHNIKELENRNIVGDCQ